MPERRDGPQGQADGCRQQHRGYAKDRTDRRAVLDQLGNREVLVFVGGAEIPDHQLAQVAAKATGLPPLLIYILLAVIFQPQLCGLRGHASVVTGNEGGAHKPVHIDELAQKRLVEIIGRENVLLDFRGQFPLLIEWAAFGHPHQEECHDDDDEQGRNGAKQSAHDETQHVDR